MLAAILRRRLRNSGATAGGGSGSGFFLRTAADDGYILAPDGVTKLEIPA